MGDKVFKITLFVLVAGSIAAAVVLGGSREELIRLGDEQEDNGAQHIGAEDSPEYNGGEPPTSGDHAQAVPKGAYQQEIPDVNSIHNLEHGYIYVSYQPSLPQETVERLEALFFEPYSNEEFLPSKVIMAPRAANESPIVLSSWQRSQKFQDFEEQTMIDYYLGNVNKSPEPLAS